MAPVPTASDTYGAPARSSNARTYLWSCAFYTLMPTPRGSFRFVGSLHQAISTAYDMRDQGLGAVEKQPALALFERQADHYATERERMPYFQSQLAVVCSMLRRESGLVLDLGCAAGGEVPDLRRLGFRVVGVDFASRMLDFAHLRFAGDPGVQFCRADVEHLRFDEESIDHVVCLGVFEYLTDYGPALSEISRVLRPGGLAIFAVPSRLSLYHISESLTAFTVRPLWRALKRILRLKITPQGPPVQENLCIPWHYRASLRAHSLEPEQSAYSNFFVYPLGRFPNPDIRVAAALECLCAVPLVRYGAFVYLVAARKRR